MSAQGNISIVAVDRVVLQYVPRAWPFAIERRPEIDAHFAALKARKPAVWNGQILLLHDFSLAGGEFRGDMFATDYASFLAWRDWGLPDPDRGHCFAMTVLRSADDAFLLGVMGGHTVNGGTIYFPAGMLDPSDVVGDVVDLDANQRRELMEETGLGAGDVEIVPGWQAVFAKPRIAFMRTVRTREPAEALRARIRQFIAREADPELADIHIVRSTADLDPRMPPFVVAYLEEALRHSTS